MPYPGAPAQAAEPVGTAAAAGVGGDDQGPPSGRARGVAPVSLTSDSDSESATGSHYATMSLCAARSPRGPVQLQRRCGVGKAARLRMKRGLPTRAPLTGSAAATPRAARSD